MHLSCLVIARNYTRPLISLCPWKKPLPALRKSIGVASPLLAWGSGQSTKCDRTLTPYLKRNVAPTDSRVSCRTLTNRVIVVFDIFRLTTRSRTHSVISKAKQVTSQKFINPCRVTKQKETLIDSLTEDKASDEISSAYFFFCYPIGSHHSAYSVHLSIDGHDIPMEINLGSSFRADS